MNNVRLRALNALDRRPCFLKNYLRSAGGGKGAKGINLTRGVLPAWPFTVPVRRLPNGCPR